MSCLTSMNPCQVVGIIAIISIILTDDLSIDELNVVGNLIVSIGSIMLTIAAQKQAQDSKNNTDESIHDINEQIEQLQKRLQKLKSQ